MKGKLYWTLFTVLAVVSLSVIYCTIQSRNRAVKYGGADVPVLSSHNDTDPILGKLPVGELAFDRSVVDFGDVHRDTMLVATFIAKNTSDNDVIIDYVNPDCTCTGYRVSKSVVPPNDTVSIVLTFDTKGKRHKQSAYTTVRANTEFQMHKLMIKANIVR